MSDQQEYEDLESLLKAPGWLRFVNAMTTRWRDDYDAHVNKAADATDDVLAVGKLRQIIAARKAVLAALEYPKERLRQLDTASVSRTRETALPLSRRGPL